MSSEVPNRHSTQSPGAGFGPGEHRSRWVDAGYNTTGSGEVTVRIPVPTGSVMDAADISSATDRK